MSSKMDQVSDTDLSAWEKVQFSETNEEKIKRLELEKDSNLQIVKRKKRIEHLIEKRKLNFEYIKNLHQGGTYFLNSVLVTRSDVRDVVDQKGVHQRARMFYYLGLSISALLELPDGPSTIKAFSQLMVEWEYTFDAAAAVQGD